MLAPNSHPMYAVFRPLIPTRPMERYATDIQLAIEQGSRGILSHGDGRVGKTYGAALLSTQTQWRRWPIAFYRMNYGLPGSPSEGYFFNAILNASNQKTINSAFGTDALARVRNHLVDQARRELAEIIGLVINESNRFSDAEYKHLVSLDNDLESFGKRLFVMLLSQNDAEPGPRQTLSPHQPSHIAGRFLMARHHYTGLLWIKPEKERDNGMENDVYLALREYDVGVCHGPEGFPCTQYFAPKAYALGWRLTTQIELFRKEINAIRAKNGWAPDAPWPMKTFEAFVYFALVRIAGEDPNFTQFTPEQVQLALELSGYLTLEQSRYPELTT